MALVVSWSICLKYSKKLAIKLNMVNMVNIKSRCTFTLDIYNPSQNN